MSKGIFDTLPQTHLAEFRGQTIEYSIAGTGKPTIILLNGAGTPIESWYKLYPDIQKFGTVLAYNRLGTGRSSRPLEPQTAHTTIQMLRQLLDELQLEKPYVFVAHSFGGVYANLYARLFPDDVGGVVFVDATAPEDIGLLKKHLTLIQKIIFKALFYFSKADPNNEISEQVEMITVDQIEKAPSFPNIPIIVITGVKSPSKWLISQTALDLRSLNQQKLAALSKHSNHVMAKNSGHFPQISEPKLVLEALTELIDSL